MKVAIVTDDGTHVHSHFGQAPYYEVVTIEDSQVVARERRNKPAHSGHHEHGGQEHHHACREAHAGDMASVIADCQILLARGMGQPAFRRLQAVGIQPYLIAEQTIDEAVQAYLQGGLQNRPERIHRH